MDFSQLKKICKTSHVPVTEIAENLNLSYDGLKRGLNNGTIGIKYVLPICSYFGITVADFFGQPKTTTGDIVYGSQQKQGKKQIMHIQESESTKQAIKILEEQLREKEEQLKNKEEQLREKDKLIFSQHAQIDKLLDQIITSK